MNEIEINVEPRYMAGQSDVYRDRYAFNYLITICNRSDEIITLRQRFGNHRRTQVRQSKSAMPA